DPFLGSGSTAIAALRRKRHFIGVEIHPFYAELAAKRFQEILHTLI
ncbi:MAG: DNA methyltransferase, partial [Bacteroidia bacterium]|nr:DNA methyltransferase [Bacteroidia bacterium]